jgi:arabinan endo-1,5-alpha-L-arabinosidase
MDQGSWADHGSTGVSSSKGAKYNAIDGNLITDGGSGAQMAFGSFWQDLFIAGINTAGGSLRRTSAPKQIAYQPAGGHEVEAPFVFPHGGDYYLFFSAGKCCGLDKKRPGRGQEYRILVCRGRRPDGPFMDKAGKSCTAGGGTMVLPSHGSVYAPGGQGVYQDPVMGTVLYYHYGMWSLSVGRSANECS